MSDNSIFGKSSQSATNPFNNASQDDEYQAEIEQEARENTEETQEDGYGVFETEAEPEAELESQTQETTNLEAQSFVTTAAPEETSTEEISYNIFESAIDANNDGTISDGYHGTPDETVNVYDAFNLAVYTPIANEFLEGQKTISQTDLLEKLNKQYPDLKIHDLEEAIEEDTIPTDIHGHLDADSVAYLLGNLAYNKKIPAKTISQEQATQELQKLLPNKSEVSEEWIEAMVSQIATKSGEGGDISSSEFSMAVAFLESKTDQIIDDNSYGEDWIQGIDDASQGNTLKAVLHGDVYQLDLDETGMPVTISPKKDADSVELEEVEAHIEGRGVFTDGVNNWGSPEPAPSDPAPADPDNMFKSISTPDDTTESKLVDTDIFAVGENGTIDGDETVNTLKAFADAGETEISQENAVKELQKLLPADSGVPEEWIEAMVSQISFLSSKAKDAPIDRTQLAFAVTFLEAETGQNIDKTDLHSDDGTTFVDIFDGVDPVYGEVDGIQTVTVKVQGEDVTLFLNADGMPFNYDQLAEILPAENGNAEDISETPPVDGDISGEEPSEANEINAVDQAIYGPIAEKIIGENETIDAYILFDKMQDKYGKEFGFEDFDKFYNYLEKNDIEYELDENGISNLLSLLASDGNILEGKISFEDAEEALNAINQGDNQSFIRSMLDEMRESTISDPMSADEFNAASNLLQQFIDGGEGLEGTILQTQIGDQTYSLEYSGLNITNNFSIVNNVTPVPEPVQEPEPEPEPLPPAEKVANQAIYGDIANDYIAMAGTEGSINRFALFNKIKEKHGDKFDIEFPAFNQALEDQGLPSKLDNADVTTILSDLAEGNFIPEGTTSFNEALNIVNSRPKPENLPDNFISKMLNEIENANGGNVPASALTAAMNFLEEAADLDSLGGATLETKVDGKLFSLTLEDGNPTEFNVSDIVENSDDDNATTDPADSQNPSETSEPEQKFNVFKVFNNVVYGDDASKFFEGDNTTITKEDFLRKLQYEYPDLDIASQEILNLDNLPSNLDAGNIAQILGNLAYNGTIPEKTIPKEDAITALPVILAQTLGDNYDQTQIPEGFINAMVDQVVGDDNNEVSASQIAIMVGLLEDLTNKDIDDSRENWIEGIDTEEGDQDLTALQATVEGKTYIMELNSETKLPNRFYPEGETRGQGGMMKKPVEGGIDMTVDTLQGFNGDIDALYDNITGAGTITAPEEILENFIALLPVSDDPNSVFYTDGDNTIFRNSDNTRYNLNTVIDLLNGDAENNKAVLDSVLGIIDPQFSEDTYGIVDLINGGTNEQQTVLKNNDGGFLTIQGQFGGDKTLDEYENLPAMAFVNYSTIKPEDEPTGDHVKQPTRGRSYTNPHKPTFEIGNVSYPITGNIKNDFGNNPFHLARLIAEQEGGDNSRRISNKEAREFLNEYVKALAANTGINLPGRIHKKIREFVEYGDSGEGRSNNNSMHVQQFVKHTLYKLDEYLKDNGFSNGLGIEYEERKKKKKKKGKDD